MRQYVVVAIMDLDQTRALVILNGRNDAERRQSKDLLHLLLTLDAVVEGGAYVQGELMQSLVNEFSGRPGSGSSLSPRERQVLQLVADGYENKQIVTELGLSEGTVKTYLRGIFQKLDVASRAEAVAVGLRLGVID